MIDEQDLRTIAHHLEARGIVFEAGLSGPELSAIEDTYGFPFPPDLRAFLQIALPVSEGFPNWRSEPEESLRKQLARPAEGILFDVEHNGVWLASWGSRPPSRAEALAMARERLAEAPTLIPVYLHRYIPAEPPLAGNPVFSVHQSDIIYYGTDLASYLAAEFGIPNPAPVPSHPRPIPFWSDFVA